jgi:hypothetical protein
VGGEGTYSARLDGRMHRGYERRDGRNLENGPRRHSDRNQTVKGNRSWFNYINGGCAGGGAGVVDAIDKSGLAFFHSAL